MKAQIVSQNIYTSKQNWHDGNTTPVVSLRMEVKEDVVDISYADGRWIARLNPPGDCYSVIREVDVTAKLYRTTAALARAQAKLDSAESALFKHLEGEMMTELSKPPVGPLLAEPSPAK